MYETNCFAKEVKWSDKRLHPHKRKKKKKSAGERTFLKGYKPINPLQVKNEG